MRRHKLEIQSTDNSNPNTDNFRIIVGDSVCERVFTVNDVSHGGCKYGIMNFSSGSRGSLSVEMCDNLYFTNRKVGGLLPASLFSNSNPGSSAPFVTLTVICVDMFNQTIKLDVFFLLSKMQRREEHRRTASALTSWHSILLSGWKAKRFHHESAITSVRVLQDENYLLAADMLGQVRSIKMWDVRVTKPVLEYKGHNNEHAYLPIHVNEHEGLLLAAANDMIPSVVFSSNLGGSRGLPGLLMAVRHDLYYFPYNTDYQEGGELCL
ncbi:hypothetical protein XENOCAPTIV_006408 [Xenoophorus captivus]|uniref:Uncharacterized protein n=1 Tax=Xenoophorus captivus TaxID=1517983 RepID=A0ABV0RQJ1_9TELE